MSIFGFIWFEPIQLTQWENEKMGDEKQRKYTLIKNDIFANISVMWQNMKHIILVMWQYLKLEFHWQLK